MKRLILVIEADEIKYSLLNKYLSDLHYTTDNIVRCTSLTEALSVTLDHIEIILADLSLHGTDSLSALQMLQHHFINVPVIVLQDNELAHTVSVHDMVQGFLVHGSYDITQLAKAITCAKEYTARIVVEHNRELHAVIKDQKEHLDSLLFYINDAIWSRNADTMELTYANNAYYNLYGYPPEEVSKTILYDSIFSDDREKFFASIKEVKTTGKTEVIYRYIHRDGNVKTLKARATLKKGDAGTPDIITGVTADISKEKELYNTIRNTEQKLLATINNTKDLIWSVNKKLEIIFCNKPYQDFIYSLGGVIPEEGNFVLGDWGSESFINSRTRDYERALKGENFTTIVEEVFNGEVMYNEISSSPIVDHDGNIIGVNCIARDISQQKKQFFKIREQNEKLREIAWIQSHKVRGPVSTILGLASLFDYESVSTEYNRDLLEQIKKVTDELDTVIKEVVNTTVDIDYTYSDTDIINSRL